MSPPTDVAKSGKPLDPYEPGAGNKHGVAPKVFYPSLIILAFVVIITVSFPDDVGEFLSNVQTDIVGGFGWYYTLLVAVFVVFSIWMGVSRFGDIKLGKDDEDAEFSLLAWFAMLFAAGMGIGLVFWGAAEPLIHYDSPKPGTDGGGALGEDGHGREGIGAEGAELAQDAMAQTFVHWGFHAWAIYVVVGLALAYAIHRKGRPVSIRWALEPVLGDRVRGWIGDVIDIIAIIGTLFGVATSLGLGVSQIAAGFVEMGVFDEPTDGVLVTLIVIITALATVSVVSGVGKGIKWLSNFNLGLAAVFLVVMLIVGPSLFFLRDFVQSMGVYLQDVLPTTFDTSTYTGDAGQAWQGSWTTYYWGWWISWAPFVGVFIARISRGRTIREFVAGVLIVPTMVTFLWFAVMGGSALYRQLYGEGGLVSRGEEGMFERVIPENVLFNMVSDLPMGGILTVIVVVLVAIFFVTSSDSGSLVVDMLASGGEPEPPKWSRVLFAVLEGAIAIALLLAGGLAALRTGAIIAALPFSVVMIVIMVATYKSLKSEHRVLQAAQRRQRREELQRHITQSVTGDLTDNFDDHFGEQVDDRIDQALVGVGALPDGERANGEAGSGDGSAGGSAGGGAVSPSGHARRLRRPRRKGGEQGKDE
ncbi:choline/glycine/proline betaine transport protein [Haloactinopolyspora alba]|uniref:Choline/glycine/proline betaine transport protein n=1 Tax=Haloactinopolyspora alba TaxID=648780 RepID=A0A2P8DX85_9ACTN|nr:BCCT family transporter [Haloactinopolyspora alba]PSL01823.1 choline/glycine/proline betaine transport protein [Haloactinopolyspora alba]